MCSHSKCGGLSSDDRDHCKDEGVYMLQSKEPVADRRARESKVAAIITVW